MRNWHVMVFLLMVPFPGVLLSRATAQDIGSEVIFSRFRHFKIPITVGAGAERLHQLQLFVSTDQGKSWEPSAVVPPTDSHFRFICERDGLYWFAVQTLDKKGKYFPSAMHGAKPTGADPLKVLVDTLPPQVKVQPLPPRNGQVGVSWEIKEEYLDFADPKSIRLEYRVADGELWTMIPINRVATHHYWNPETSALLEVRLRVQDRAENLGEALVKVSPSGGDQVGSLPGMGENPPDNPPTQPPEGYAGAANRHLVNSKRISLNYELEDVGPSGVSEIELWYTQDGRSWSKYPLSKSPGEDKMSKPLVFEVSSEGVYGFTLVAKNGVGRGKQPPQIGDTPQIWVEVDLTKPTVQLQNIIVGQGVDKGEGKLMINWLVRDKNLGPRPITLSHSEQLTGPWTPIVSGIANTGQYIWSIPEGDLYQFYLRVEAVDQAENVGQAVSSEMVKVDLAQPKVINLKVESAPGH